MKRPFVTVILAGGKGTRMGSSDKHKVCFEVMGVPVILRALETYNLCGSLLNLVVVGMQAEGVMATVNRRFPGTAFAFQEQPLGTGHATRRAVEILERLGFAGDILVVAGDKMIEPRVIQRLLATHQRTRADITLAMAPRPPGSSTGILLTTARGNIVGILEEAERLRLVALDALATLFKTRAELSPVEIEQAVRSHCPEKEAQQLLQEVWPDDSPRASLNRAGFARLFPREQRSGWLTVGSERVRVADILQRFNQMNLSTYLFRAPVLYEALGRLKTAQAGREEYLTDVFALLAQRKKPARVTGCVVADPTELMAFNNPQELLAVEAAWRHKAGAMAVEAGARPGPRLVSGGAWEALLQSPSPAARRQFQQWYGAEVPWDNLRQAVRAFMNRFGPDRPVCIVRSPGRINLLGRHIDHQGGTVNVMAINREVITVAAPRTDDQVTLDNADGTRFAGHTFRISDLVANLNWDDWQRVIDGPRLQRLLDEARGDWANYAKASILRLQELFRDRQLRGMDLMVSGNIPMGAGLSSSSALVVAVAETVTAFNQLPVSGRRLVSLCGEGEWFVGTRGGAADHAAIKLSRRGYVTRVGFFPFQIEDSAPFLPEHDLVVCNSGIYAGKSHAARNTFNAKVTAYHLGRVWFKMLRPDLAPRIAHLRDVNAAHLGLSRKAFAELLLRLPARLTRAQAQAAFAQMIPEDRERLERLFLSHDAPAEGYAVRDVVLFGLSEMARARQCLDLLRQRDGAGLGRLMTLSHDGDRVAREGARGGWRRCAMSVSDRDLQTWSRQTGARGNIAALTGAYACSLPEIDRIVDIACREAGVEGAQLAGAGLGGCVMVLVQKPQTQALLKQLTALGIQADVFRPIAGACSLVVR